MEFNGPTQKEFDAVARIGGKRALPVLSTGRMAGRDSPEYPGEDVTPVARKTNSLKTPSTPCKPKNRGIEGASSRASGNGGFAVRSLIPVFNGFSAAAERAQRLGGRYSVIQRNRKGSKTRVSKECAGTRSSVSRKRVKEEDCLSVKTVSRGNEQRLPRLSQRRKSCQEQCNSLPRL
eukprot:jgi/Picsp_1/1354/NSC_04834-R1_---NA---